MSFCEKHSCHRLDVTAALLTYASASPLTDRPLFQTFRESFEKCSNTALVTAIITLSAHRFTTDHRPGGDHIADRKSQSPIINGRAMMIRWVPAYDPTRFERRAFGVSRVCRRVL